MNNANKVILGGSCILVGCAIGDAIQSIRKLILTKKITKAKEEELRLLKEKEACEKEVKALKEAMRKIEEGKAVWELQANHYRSIATLANNLVEEIEAEETV